MANRYKIIRLSSYTWTVQDMQTGRWLTDGGVSYDVAKITLKDMNSLTPIEVGAKIRLVLNFTTRDCTVVKIQKHGRIVVQAEEVRNAAGRRLYAAQRFTVDPESMSRVTHLRKEKV